MFTPTTDYNQQLLAYLQAWRQLLEQLTAMAAALPFPTAPFVIPAAPWGGQSMPPTVPLMQPPPTAPVPPTPPAPADYTQQLFSYLQAWRQYLEQMTGATPGSPQPPTAQPTKASMNPPANDGGKAPPSRPPDGPIPPGDDAGSKNVPGSDVRKESAPPWPPPLVDIQPTSYGGSQVVSTGFDPASPYGPFDPGAGEPLVLNPPDYDFGYQFRAPRRRPTAAPAVSSAGSKALRHAPEAAAQQPVGSPFRSVMERVEPTASPQIVPKSLFSSPGAQAASTRPSEVRETPSP